MSITIQAYMMFICVAGYLLAVAEAKIKCDAKERSCKTVDQCVEKKKFCDGVKDCPDDSDEARCDKRRVRCSGDQWRCTHDKKCIPATKLCDGADDCGDNSDESRCNRKSKQKASGKKAKSGEEKAKLE